MVPWRMSSMGVLSALALLLVCVLGPPGCLGQGRVQSGRGAAGGGAPLEPPEEELREQDALCHETGCYVVHYQRRTFRESWRSCRDKGGNLATVRSEEEAGAVRALLASAEGRGPRTRLRLWIGLQRQPRQCTAARPLRGFTWVTGEQESDYANWARADPPGSCAVPRCVAVSVNTAEAARDQHDNFRWLDGACALAVDGFLCQHSYRGMCPPLAPEGGGHALYTTPFGLVSTRLTHLPYGSVAAMPCPPGAGESSDQSVLCMEREGGAVGWSKDPPLCSAPPRDPCEDNNGGCDHYCLSADDAARSYCQCSDGFALGDDGTSCHLEPDPEPTTPAPAPPAPPPPCSAAGCEFDCEETPLRGGFRCTCPHGYLLGRDGRSCVDVDECHQRPCQQVCVNAPGTFECRCRHGYEADGDGECVCRRGYRPDREGECVDVDECEGGGSGGGGCQQMCLNYVGGFECYCLAGYELRPDGVGCTPLPEEDYGGSSAATPSSATPTTTPELDLPDDDPGYDPDPRADWLTDAPGPEEQTPSSPPAIQHERFTIPGPVAVVTAESGTGYGAGGEAETGAGGVKTDAGASSSSSSSGGGGGGGHHQESHGNRKKHDKSWLLVALLVPLCVFVVVMLALGIVYCTSCAVDQDQSLADCYRWALPPAPAAAENRTAKTAA